MSRVSKVDWCLTNKITGLISQRGRFSIPVTRVRMPRMVRAPQMIDFNQLAPIQYTGSPLMNTETKSR